jgi:hypothetical protein
MANRDSDLGSIMPNVMAGQFKQEESLGTTEIRQYMNAAYIPGSMRRPSGFGIDPMVTPAGKVVSKRLSMAMTRAMNEGTPVTGRGPAKKFCIRIRKQGTTNATPAALREAQLDPEELKDALLQQAMAQRRALVSKSLRRGTGRDVKRPKYNLKVVEIPKMRQPELVPMTSSQQGGVASPFRFGPAKELSPMEGVPERLGDVKDVRLSIQPPMWNMSEDLRRESIPMSPMEGIPEFHAIAPMRTVAQKQSQSPVNDMEAMPPPPPVDMGNDADFDDFGGFDDYGPMDDDFGPVDDGPGFVGGWNEPLPGRESAQIIAPKRKRIILNPGIRLRNELPRKSLAVDVTVGRQEVAPGLRRSTRRAQEPLRWWLGEKKQFDRVRHKTMPTISAVMIADPSSPWKTVDDPIGARQDKYKKSKPVVVKKQTKKQSRKKVVKDEMTDDDASDDETVLIGSPKEKPKVDTQALPPVTEGKDEETLVINPPAHVDENLDSPLSKEPQSVRMSLAHSVDPSDVTVPLRHKRGSTPTSKKDMGIIIEADGSCGSADNTGNMSVSVENEDDEIIISGRAATPSKAPAVSETMVLPHLPAERTDAPSPSVVNQVESERKETDLALDVELTLNNMGSPDVDGHRQNSQAQAGASIDQVDNQEMVEMENDNSKNEEVKTEQFVDESAQNKENIEEVIEEPSPTKSPTKDVGTRRSARTRNQKKVLDV